MDQSNQKATRKHLKEQYKHQELVKQAEDQNPVISSYARIQLGINLPSITQQTIESAADEHELTLQLYHKIVEKAVKHNPATRNPFGQVIDRAVEQFSEYLQAIYHMYTFECLLAIGDIGKIFGYQSETEKDDLATQIEKLRKAYQLMNCSKMIHLLENVQKSILMRNYRL